MTETIRLFGISGSLRKDSFNTALLRAAQELAPAGLSIEMADLSQIPLYNDDLREKGYPAPVQTLREQIGAADAVLIVTPEYNYSIPGVLKNTIDWASRPPEQPFDGKIIGIMGASPGRLGTARAQYHLRQCFVFLNSTVLNKPEVMVAGAATIFKEGRLADDATRGFVADLLKALAVAVEKQRKLAG
jgi:chromate reductase, NAD(P)H dehydrogenase (quinone)